MTVLKRSGLVAIVVILAIQSDGRPDDEQERAAKFEQVIKTMQAFAIKPADSEGGDLKLVMPPVLRYSDSVQTAIFPKIPDGAVFVFTHDGMPGAVTAMHLGTSGRIWAEFLALSTKPLVVTRGETLFWKSTETAANFQPLRDVQQPSRTAIFRLSQMRGILKSFSASITDQSSGRQELRLLPQPVFRYSQPAKGIVDGAIFVFARTTNPEVLLALEARRENDKDVWVYSPLRFTGRQSDICYQGSSVWTHGSSTGNRADTTSFYQTLIEPEPMSK